MKKVSFIALVLMTLSLAACHKQTPPEDPSSSKAWAVDETLPVPILFGHGDIFQIQTKASESPLTSLSGVKVSVSALDDSMSEFLFNAQAATIDAGGTVTLSRTRYYPMPGQNEVRRNYSFYAYRTSIDGNNPALTLSGSDLTVDFNLDPIYSNTDVLYAVATAADYTNAKGTFKGFNAEYCRQITADGVDATYGPALVFSHAASCLRFVIKSDGTPQSAYLKSGSDVSDFKITAVTIGGIYKSVRLNVATGVLSVRGTTTSSVYTGNIIPSPTGEEIGTGMFVAPGEYPKTISVTYTDKEGISHTTSQVQLPMPSGGYLAQYNYAYNIVIASPVDVTLTATMGDWNHTDMGDVNIF